MKYIFLFFLSLLVLSVYSQDITPKNLLGSYEWVDALEPTEFEFTPEGNLLIKTKDRTVRYMYYFEESSINAYVLKIYAPSKVTYRMTIFINSPSNYFYLILTHMEDSKKEIILRKIL